MSNKNNNGNAGVVTGMAMAFAGVAAAAYWAYKTFKEDKTEEILVQDIARRQRQLQLSRLHQADLSLSATTNSSQPSASWKCEICEKNIQADLKKLPCGHWYHIKCLEANYVLYQLKEVKGSFKCPILTCSCPIPASVTASWS